MRCPSGILGTRLLFIAVNLFLVLGWAKQMRDEGWKEKVEKEERMRDIRRQVDWWDDEIVRLEGALRGERVDTPPKSAIWYKNGAFHSHSDYDGEDLGEEEEREDDTGEQKKQRQLAEAAALEQAETEFEQQLRTDALLATVRDSAGSEGKEGPNYERDSVVNGHGVKEWDFVVGAKSEKGKEFGNSGLKELNLGSAGSRLPKLRKKKNLEEAE